jgi:MoxR-like ATPase
VAARFVPELRRALGEVVVGQERLLDMLIIGVLTGGHVLLEGVPGLAKTLAVSSLAKAVDGTFARIQFTPDLLPSDLIGTDIYNAKDGSFSVRRGPVFANFVLADEINRAPSKVQSALLEAMAERQVSIGGTTHPLPKPFLVLATQNPLEQEGTYPLPEAQLDRFALKVIVSYPTPEEELVILGRMASTAPRLEPRKVVGLPEVMEARAAVVAFSWMNAWRSTSSAWWSPRANRAVMACPISLARCSMVHRRAPRFGWRSVLALMRCWLVAPSLCRVTSKRSRWMCCGTA